MAFTAYSHRPTTIRRQCLPGNVDAMPEGNRAGATAMLGALLALAWLVPTPAAAARAALPEQVRCESPDTRRVHCPMDTSRGVVLVRQLSQNACIRDTDWGVDTLGVWVARGCRAEFRARPGADVATRRVVRCESSRGRNESCPVILRGAPVRLLRELASAPCRRGESWDVGRNEIRVSRGCKGEFEIGDAETGFPPGARLLECESRDRRRRSCGTTVEREVVLVRQLSNSACEKDRTWGWDAERVWVDEGCRAEFAVD